MAKIPSIPEPSQEARKALRDEYGHLLSIEGNPLTDEERTMFDMFDQKGLNSEERLAHVKALFASPSTDNPPVGAGAPDVE